MLPIRKILAPVDFDAPSRVALNYAVGLAEQLGASVDALHLWEPSTTIWPECVFDDAETSVARLEVLGKVYDLERLEQFVLECCGERSAKVRRRYGLGPAARGIVTLVEREGYELVVLGTHGRRGLARAVEGSVAEQVLRHAAVPIVALRTAE